jgi:NADH-quinone oxidoreductase subunit F
VGTVRQEEALHRICHARSDLVAMPEGRTAATRAHSDDLALLDELGAAMRDASICGLGQTAHSAVESAIHRLGIFDGRAVARGGTT